MLVIDGGINVEGNSNQKW